MKKLITLVMLGIFAVMNVNAAEQTLWEGDYNVDWDLTPDNNPNREWGGGEGQDVTSYFIEGEKINVYLTVAGTDYHKCQFDNWEWQSLPGLEPVVFSEDTKVTIEVTADIAAAVQEKGFRLHGHGFHVTKVTKEYTITDIAPKLLWKGNKIITGYAPGNGLHLNLKTLDITTACNMYLLVEVNGTGDLRFTRNNNGWADWPAEGTNLCTGNIDANNIIKVALPQDFVTAVIEEGEGDGYWHEIVIWGNNLTIKAIATTKETLLNKIHTDANGYATYSSNNTLALNNLPAGLEAYTATLTSITLSFAQKTDAVGPETGLLFKGDADTDYFIPATTDATAVFDNALKACVAGGALASTVSDYIFVMQKATTAGSLTFKKLSTTGVTMPANKAYVQVAASAFPTLAHELSISFGEGEVTGISEATLLNINEVIKNNNVYDLSGRRVAKPTKGLYIVNGKKVVIK